MSTKIYNGYILPPMSAFQLMELNNRLKVKMKATQEILLKKKLGALCAEILQQYKDNPKFGDQLMSRYSLSDFEKHKDRPPYTPTPVYTLAAKIFNIKSNRIQTTMQRDPEYDLSFDIAYMPMRTKILAYIFYDNGDMLKAFETQKEFSEYGYWNNSDRPDNVTATEWRQRKNDWDKVIDWGTFADRGFTNEVVPKGEIAPIAFNWIDHKTGEAQRKEYVESVIEHIPSYESRVTDYVYNKAFEDKYKEATSEKWTKRWNETRYFLRSDEGKKYLQVADKKYRKDVIKTFSVADLESKVAFVVKNEKE